MCLDGTDEICVDDATAVMNDHRIDGGFDAFGFSGDDPDA